MYIGKIGAIVTVAAGLGIAGSAFAEEPTLRSGTADETGLSTLGIDITPAGSGAESVSMFLAGLAPETHRMVVNGCETAIANPATYNVNVLEFCRTAVGAPIGPSLGFAPQEPAFVPGEQVFETDMLPPAASNGAY